MSDVREWIEAQYAAEPGLREAVAAEIVKILHSPEECPLRRWDRPDCPCETN